MLLSSEPCIRNFLIHRQLKTVFSPMDAHRTTKSEAAAHTDPADLMVKGITTKDGEDQSLEA